MSRPPIETSPPAVPGRDDHAFRETFGAHELAIVLSHYDLGVIEKLRDYPRGSRRAPKVRISSRTGEFLLKRRAIARNDPFRVAFTHNLVLHLGDNGYPVARLIGTRVDNNSMLQLEGHIYELFEYVPGRRWDKSVEQTREAGRAMGRMHALLGDCDPGYDPPTGTFHAADVGPHVARIPAAVRAAEPGTDETLIAGIGAYLAEMYEKAAQQAERAGFAGWVPSLIHGDWHPGNLLFRRGRLVAVLDFDSARLEPRIADVANGALQFGMRMRDPADPDTWPDGLDARRIGAFIRGYDEGASRPLEPGEREALPWLMVEALVIETIVPIAATGSFARIRGSSFLRMVERKLKWIEPRARKLTTFLEEVRDA